MLKAAEKRTEKVLGEPETTGMLGLIWQPNTDTLAFKVKPYYQALPISKRMLASEAAKLYDPEGLITPITINSKMLLQNVWRTGCDWDENVDDESAMLTV